MKPPSRRMPTAPPRRASWWAWSFLAAMLAGLGYWIYQQPYVALFVIALAVLTAIQMAFETRWRRRIAASRWGESICDFVRSFDRGLTLGSSERFMRSYAGFFLLTADRSLSAVPWKGALRHALRTFHSLTHGPLHDDHII